MAALPEEFEATVATVLVLAERAGIEVTWHSALSAPAGRTRRPGARARGLATPQLISSACADGM